MILACLILDDWRNASIPDWESLSHVSHHDGPSTVIDIETPGAVSEGQENQPVQNIGMSFDLQTNCVNYNYSNFQPFTPL